MGPEGSLPHSQVPTTCPNPELDRSSPCPPSHFSKIHFNVILPSTPEFSEGPLSYFTTKTSSSLYALHAVPICMFLVWSPEWYLVRSTEHKAPRYVVFSNNSITKLCNTECVTSSSTFCTLLSLLWRRALFERNIQIVESYLQVVSSVNVQVFLYGLVLSRCFSMRVFVSATRAFIFNIAFINWPRNT